MRKVKLSKNSAKKQNSIGCAAGEEGGGWREYWGCLGPGLIAGAADDDPSGVATYTMAGARFGTRFLWTALLTWPLMAVVQMACARVGLATGNGLAKALRQKFSFVVILPLCVALFVANTLNAGADLAAMAESVNLVVPIPVHLLVILFGTVSIFSTVYLRYQQIARLLKWLALCLLSYILVALILRPDWAQVLGDLVRVQRPQGKEQWGLLVAILGTTISPYLFFWQASQEVEERKALPDFSTLPPPEQAREVWKRRVDISFGTLASNVVMVFIILSSALTLNREGLTEVQTSREAMRALIPVAGSFAAWLYGLGILGVGMLTLPTLTGSAAFALAEVFGWREGLDEKFQRAKAFYAVVIGSGMIAMMLNFTKVPPMRALYASALINGLLAPPLLAALLWLMWTGKDPFLRGPWWMRAVLGVTVLIMGAAVIGLF